MIVTKHAMTRLIEKFTWLPNSREVKESSNSLQEAIIMAILINREKTYSAFPCPKLCVSSFGSLAILFPTNVKREARMSEAEFAASAIMAWL